MTDEIDPVLRSVDTVIADLAVRPARYVGRREQDGDAETFVIQDGEEGRLRLARPDLSSPSSVVAMAQAAQSYLCGELGEPVPRCPLHAHALDLLAVDAGYQWACPSGRWRCALGEYAEQASPHFESGQRPGVLARRLTRREIAGVRSIGITESASGQVATFGVAEVTPELLAALRDAAAPLGVEVHEERRPARRPSAPIDSPEESGPAGPEPSRPHGGAAPHATVRLVLAESFAQRGGELGFAVVNNGTTPILMGVDYALERRADGWWEAVDPECWFTAVGLIVDPGQRRGLIARIPTRAIPGAYRLRKNVRPAGCTPGGCACPPIPDDPWIELTAEFRVDG